ncbi:hypothetical protein FE257_007872 [Aspergillus nanangensis]|uniref:Myb-like DNA-binding domain protein n=1 Tax=Aspergillus nanangensis TaxID=2582783 RepID=A0AAD4CX71_ASPNN|nr:hypothetical protein FE257_007872 [Aspergillus nanangensis]
MESPTKRPRLDYTSEPNHSEPEDYAELEEDLDDIGLEQARAQNDLRLKSIFEGIFEKYGKDFTEIGDEIDLNTGDIVVNNGHVFTMDEEDDTGEKEELCIFDDDLPASPTGKASGFTVKSLTDFMEAETGGDMPGYEDTVPQNEPITSPLQTGLNLTNSWAEPENEATNLDSDADDDDDLSSMDLVMGVPLNVQNDAKQPNGPRQKEDTGKPVTEKAKPAAETPAQSKNDPFGGPSLPVESLWRAPEIDMPFSTPTISKPAPISSIKSIRPASPPGSGSLWALPKRTTGGARSRSVKKPRASSEKKKHHSSPVVYDWSFAETRDGSESDDPLLEDHQPSPTPKSLAYRGRQQGPDTPHRPIDRDCKTTFSRDDHMSQPQTVVESDIGDGQHDLAVKTQSEAISTVIEADTCGGDKCVLASAWNSAYSPLNVGQESLA